MCIIQGEVLQVASTKIFVADVDNQTQLTVYSNNVLLPNGKTAAMILPFVQGPNFKVLNLQNHQNIFDILKHMFVSNLRFRGGNLSTNSAPDCLPIIQIGSYDVTIIPSFQDFHRLQYGHFQLEPDVGTLLGNFYANNYGFLVCKLRQNASFHPIGYTSNKLSKGTFFVPTKHYHKPNEHADWDHSIYVNTHKYFIPNLVSQVQESASGWDHEHAFRHDLNLILDGVWVKQKQDFRLRRFNIHHHYGNLGNNHDVLLRVI
jgi:hypothetical protein